MPIDGPIPHRERRRFYRAIARGLSGQLSAEGVSTAVTPVDCSAGGVLVEVPAGLDPLKNGAAVMLAFQTDDGASTTRNGTIVRTAAGETGQRVAVRFDPDEAAPMPPSLHRLFNRRRAERVTPVRPTPVDLVLAPEDHFWRSFVTARMLDASMGGVALAVASAHAVRFQNADLLSMRVYLDTDPVGLMGELVSRTRIGVHERLGVRLVWDSSPRATDSRAALRDWLMHRRYMSTWSPGPAGP